MKTADLEVGQTYIEPIPGRRGGWRDSRTVFRVLGKATQAERAAAAGSYNAIRTIEVEPVGRVKDGCYSPILRKESRSSTWVAPAKLGEPFDVEEAKDETVALLRRREERRKEATAEVERIQAAFARLDLPEDFPLPMVVDNPYRPDKLVETPRLSFDRFSQLAEAIETLLEDR